MCSSGLLGTWGEALPARVAHKDFALVFSGADLVGSGDFTAGLEPVEPLVLQGLLL